MEQFIREIEVWAARHDTSPQRILREVIDAPWGLWQKWKEGTSSPTMRTADKIRDHLAKHPASPTSEDAA
ncbi:hypothetical protein [Paracoccus sp. (in: a-proteobacteria)]|uniref:hypothetical protein n=1 Tax=Paracoccus sp. TaxID=267 RepID=UPI00258F6115|nr:hypothetical protein [Paracoccus sp. (in: a-proteobacteria)]